MAFETSMLRTAMIQAGSTAVLVIVTIFYAWKTWSLAKSAREQLAQARQFVERQEKFVLQEKEQHARKNIRAIYIELKMNNSAEDFMHRGPLLDTAYSSCLWSLAFLEVDDKMLSAVADAYLSIKRHAAFVDVRVNGVDATDRSWELAHRNIKTAIRVMEQGGYGQKSQDGKR